MSNFLNNKLEQAESLKKILAVKLADIDEYNFKFSLKSQRVDQKQLKELKQISTIESIGSSTRIEGSSMLDHEIKELIEDLEINKLKLRDEQEVAGYYEALDIIYENYDLLNLSESYIKQLHHILLKYSEKDIRHKGEYKALSNKVVAKFKDDTSKVIFNTTDPFLTPKEMENLIEWTNKKLESSDEHKLLVIAVFVYEFLSVHPFQDGNGRLSRLLTNLLLMRYGYHFIQYVSFEHEIETRKKLYYQTLMDGQKNRYSSKEDISLWLVYFLDCLENMTRRLDMKLDSKETSIVDMALNDREQKIITLLQTNHTVRVADILKQFPEIKRPTLSLDLLNLIKQGKILKYGEGRGTFYRLVE